jgi:hypothetical protein
MLACQAGVLVAAACLVLLALAKALLAVLLRPDRH